MIQIRPRSSKVMRDRVDDVRLAGDELDREPLGHGHLAIASSGESAGPGGRS